MIDYVIEAICRGLARMLFVIAILAVIVGLVIGWIIFR
jgi:uncharacterized membrane-anchored protein YhcB (DUF1043 family)